MCVAIVAQDCITYIRWSTRPTLYIHALSALLMRAVFRTFLSRHDLLTLRKGTNYKLCSFPLWNDSRTPHSLSNRARFVPPSCLVSKSPLFRPCQRIGSCDVHSVFQSATAGLTKYVNCITSSSTLLILYLRVPHTNNWLREEINLKMTESSSDGHSDCLIDYLKNGLFSGV
jgi:hypothetical protein